MRLTPASKLRRGDLLFLPAMSDTGERLEPYLRARHDEPDTCVPHGDEEQDYGQLFVVDTDPETWNTNQVSFMVKRVGLDGVPQTYDEDEGGSEITTRNDTRVLRVGRLSS